MQEAVGSVELLLARLEQMRAEYRLALPARFAELVAAARRVRQARATLGEATRLAHTLAGTAGSYGFPEFGDACSAVEQAIIEAAADERWQRVETALASAQARLPGAAT
jgi:HPt (histidine-containing phosphotransfer) domain-containing protein